MKPSESGLPGVKPSRSILCQDSVGDNGLATRCRYTQKSQVPPPDAPDPRPRQQARLAQALTLSPLSRTPPRVPEQDLCAHSWGQLYPGKDMCLVLLHVPGARGPGFRVVGKPLLTVLA